MHPDDLVNLGINIAEELSRIANGFHDKDDQHDGWAGAAEDAREKADEVRSLLTLPRLVETLANAPALSQADELPKTASPDQKRAQFDRIYEALAPAFADALKSAWLGEWEINDDGLIATLRITQRQPAGADPAQDLGIEYTDAGGVIFRGWAKKFDARGHHLRFFVSFGAMSRDFDAYLFKWDKCKLAGISEGRGFCAVKMRGLGTDRV